MFDPAAAESAAAGEDTADGLERLNENIEQLLESVDAVAADVAEARSHLERLTRSAPDDPEAVNGTSGIEVRITVHTADFYRWIESDRRRRRWWPVLATGIAAPAALLLGLLVEQQYQVIPLHDPTGGWRGHIWEQYWAQNRRLRGRGEKDRCRSELPARGPKTVTSPGVHRKTAQT